MSVRNYPAITGWNYRVVRLHDAAGESFAIREVYYGTAGTIVGWVDNCTPSGDSLDELRGDLDLIEAALRRPVIDESELPRDKNADGAA